jgi:diguanylate cyclase (GGDEF)-like protein
MLTIAERSVIESDLSDVLSEFARTMVTEFPIQGILDHLVKRIVEIMPVTAVGVTLISPGRDPRYVAASDESALLYEKLQTELGQGPCLAAFGSDKAISVPDLRLEKRFPLFSPRALESGLAAVFTFPLRHRHLQLGALDLYRDAPGPLSLQSMTAAQTLADVAAAYLINAQARSDLEDSSDQSREAALHDPLTGLPNRVLMLQLLEHAFRVGRRSGKLSAVLFVDLDRFKLINDTYGHQVGDELLVAVAQRLTGLLRPGDSLARLSGDEFVILCEDLADPSGADPIAVRLSAELARPFALSTVEVTVSASIGIAFTGQGIDEPEELLRDADLAMYRLKRGRMTARGVLDLRELHLAGHQAGLARSLPGAIGRGEVHLEYQPIVDAVDGRMTGVEALARWTHPSRGAVAPAVFIPFAEQSGQIVELGRWVLEQSCCDRHQWQQQSAAEIAMSVNVSAHQFMSAGFAATVAAVLATTATDPTLVTLEVTESVFVRDEERALVVLDELKAIGVTLALDDFGTGYSSLGYLNTLPIDTIKVDQTFIAKLSPNPASRAIVTAIIQLAHSIGMTVVCEGVETAQQHEDVTQLGSDGCQGFYFARPMPASSVAALVRSPPGGIILRLPSSSAGDNATVQNSAHSPAAPTPAGVAAPESRD